MANLRTIFFSSLVLFALFAFFIHKDQWFYTTLRPIFPNALNKKYSNSLTAEQKSMESLVKATFAKIHSNLTTLKTPASVSKHKSTSNSSPETRTAERYQNSPISGTVASVTGIQRDSSNHFFRVSQWKRLVKNVDCQALIRADKGELKRTYGILKSYNVTSKPGSYYINLTKNCADFKSKSGYIQLPVNKIEANFSIAFSILMYKDIEQFERLLRAIYRPQNLYCIHVDKKADPAIKKGTRAIAECFDNVYILPDPVAVHWGTFAVLQPELKCMKLLWTKKKWKYFINLTGQEFPLKTNLELVRILHAYNGTNNLEGTRNRADLERWENVVPAPHRITPTKGSVHIAVCRGYVDYVLHNPVAKDLLEWVKKTMVPDETFFSTLNHNPHLGVPGAYMGEPETGNIYRFLTRYKRWQGNGLLNWGCHGKHVHTVCIFGLGDLPELTSIPHLFANKFHWDFQHFTRDCLEEWHFNKTRDELIHPSSLNITFYKELSFVKLAVRPGNITVT